MISRRPTRQVKIGGLTLGGDAPVRLQSMCTTRTADVEATVGQISRLEEAGCELVRVAVPEEEDARALGKIKSRIKIPLVADIHFNYRYALIALEEGVDKLRLNPGNIGSRDRVEAVVKKAKERNVPVRIGVNAGSLQKNLLKKYGHPGPEAIVESAFEHIRILEELDFRDIVVSLKSSDVGMTIASCRLFREKSDYPLHLGVTEAGTLLRGSVYSAVGMGVLLAEGIGETIRVSLTADPVEEVKVGRMILQSLGLRKDGARVISCPTCGRADIDVIKLANEVETRAQSIRRPLTIAVMGCEVNGPGEATEADFGITGGKEVGMIY
ncbi:MAG TPA: flavodoxin-dependent (E)-4-hydroxy-3-methylbut-2-enyl-diphosphate synthase, partial [Candidatus Omnitrophota bacterium]|nr:flavodoxin-dependent (E)-4-hydroxy-3-methylbut-2-enyl-diphosphate synthase [Candidatus Omnitrophota bacterium]